ncbi:Hypothetical predicted protein [Cloeon dipterum]|uniref:Uncharacterized protein n=1 Tax=Cloeon dipterum TaxID=197152 RepID=A0A8S1CLP9_9INSE|nr:Hypothetical predicted protein [Cloeon dipterum]
MADLRTECISTTARSTGAQKPKIDEKYKHWGCCRSTRVPCRGEAMSGVRSLGDSWTIVQQQQPSGVHAQWRKQCCA